jgi:ferric-dicitrate binding protein FerR (iron transport regulator)
LIVPRQAANDLVTLSEDTKPSPTEIAASFTIADIDSSKLESERIETAWLYSRLEFRGNSFEDLAKKMERWYNVSISFTDDKVKLLSFDGSFEKENIEQALVALKAANAFTYKINDNEISIGSPE